MKRGEPGQAGVAGIEPRGTARAISSPEPSSTRTSGADASGNAPSTASGPRSRPWLDQGAAALADADGSHLGQQPASGTSASAAVASSASPGTA